MPRNISETFECAVNANDILSVEPSRALSRGVCLEITDPNGSVNVMLTYEHVKILRKVLKKCMNRHGN